MEKKFRNSHSILSHGSEMKIALDILITGFTIRRTLGNKWATYTKGLTCIERDRY